MTSEVTEIYEDLIYTGVRNLESLYDVRIKGQKKNNLLLILDQLPKSDKDKNIYILTKVGNMNIRDPNRGPNIGIFPQI